MIDLDGGIGPIVIPDRIIDIIDRIIPFPVIPGNDETAADDIYTTLLLSGGGAKGCFQAGAIAFLANLKDQRFVPNLVCGTSVGAVNGLLAAQNAIIQKDNLEDIRTAHKLIKIWLSLEGNADFFVLHPDVDEHESTILGGILGIADASIQDLAGALLGEPYNLHESEKREGGFSGGGLDLPVGGILAGIFGPLLLPGIIPIIAGPVAPLLTGLGIMAKALSENVEELMNIRSFFSLNPVKKHIEENLDFDLIKIDYDDIRDLVKGDQVEVRLVSVDLNSGNVCWVDNRGFFNELFPSERVRERYHQEVRIDITKKLFGENVSRVGAFEFKRSRLSFEEIITKGAIGSAAIPVAFPSENVYFCRDFTCDKTRTKTLVDGGVRDVLPVQAAIPVLRESHRAEKRNLVINIHCSYKYPPEHFLNTYEGKLLLEPFERPDTYEPPRKFWDLKPATVEQFEIEGEGSNILDFVFKSFELQLAEVDRTDELELRTSKVPFSEIDISPSFDVNAVGQIDKGLIRIQLAYGWLRAADMVYLHHNLEGHEGETDRDVLSPLITPFFKAFKLTDEIIRLRMNAWRHELRFEVREYSSGVRRIHWSVGAIETIRTLKKKIRNKINARKALPIADYEHYAVINPAFFEDKTENSWLDFELHSNESLKHQGSEDEIAWALNYLEEHPESLWGEWLDVNGAPIPSDSRPEI